MSESNTEKCTECGAVLSVGDWPFCPHGPVQNYGIQTDERWIGGKTFENMAATPLTFHSRQAWKAKMQELGIRNEPRHIGLPGSDKNPHTQRFL